MQPSVSRSLTGLQAASLLPAVRRPRGGPPARFLGGALEAQAPLPVPHCGAQDSEVDQGGDGWPPVSARVPLRAGGERPARAPQWGGNNGFQLVTRLSVLLLIVM